ncbi:MAG: glycoside hydrolase family 99-like domain-containing protein [Alistipes sp.]|jgi:lipopolysaccharide biosynthesis protein|nr:glycoside hydrolase family 99-like domain-containing protein [Alistipes sp.]
MEADIKARVFALYLPQFHPIPENDRWWGKGFTEWTNVGKAPKYYRGHYQPRVPADLGYYDLRVPETRQAQADMAKACGVEGFIYWHYWFGNGKRLLERPFNEVLESGKPDFPFALAWANETWRGFWHGLKNRNTLIEQQYPGDEDYTAHFHEVLPAFRDKRYITVDGKPLFIVYRPEHIPDPEHFVALWQRLARENGLSEGIYFVGVTSEIVDSPDPRDSFDALNFWQLSAFWGDKRSLFHRARSKLFNILSGRPPRLQYYRDFVNHRSNDIGKRDGYIPTILPGWDHTPRSGKKGKILHGFTPELFARHARQVIESVNEKPFDRRLVIVKSWNEWAEGNYMEPDLKWGYRFLDVLRQEVIVQ